MNWKPITENEPPLDELVWLHEPRRGTWIGNRSDPDGDGWLWGNSYGVFWWNGTRWDADVEQDSDYDPTLWQPLPMPPNL